MAPELQKERRKYVQKLRVAARACGVALVADDAGRKKVQGMMSKIRASEGGADTKEKAETAFAAFEATFAPAQDDAPAAHAQARGEQPQERNQRAGFRLRGRSFLLTYNWKFLSRTLPDGTPAPASHDDLWNLWLAWKKGKKQELGVAQSTSTLERSLDSKDKDRVHFHWKVNLKESIDWDKTDNFAFHGVKPNAEATVVPQTTNPSGTKRPRGANFREASNRGHFYAWVNKKGTLFRGTNWAPWKDYRVLGKWLDDLWTDHKLEHKVYEEMAMKVRVGFSNRKRDLEQAQGGQ